MAFKIFKKIEDYTSKKYDVPMPTLVQNAVFHEP